MHAELVRTLPASHPGHDIAIYRLDPMLVVGPRWEDDDRPTRHYRYVVVSAIPAAFDTGRPETFIFGADFLAAERGSDDVDELLRGQGSWIELRGSASGDVSHAEALAGAGYTLV